MLNTSKVALLVLTSLPLLHACDSDSGEAEAESDAKQGAAKADAPPPIAFVQPAALNSESKGYAGKGAITLYRVDAGAGSNLRALASARSGGIKPEAYLFDGLDQFGSGQFLSPASIVATANTTDATFRMPSDGNAFLALRSGNDKAGPYTLTLTGTEATVGVLPELQQAVDNFLIPETEQRGFFAATEPASVSRLDILRNLMSQTSASEDDVARYFDDGVNTVGGDPVFDFTERLYDIATYLAGDRDDDPSGQEAIMLVYNRVIAATRRQFSSGNRLVDLEYLVHESDEDEDIYMMLLIGKLATGEWVYLQYFEEYF